MATEDFKITMTTLPRSFPRIHVASAFDLWYGFSSSRSPQQRAIESTFPQTEASFYKVRTKAEHCDVPRLIQSIQSLLYVGHLHFRLPPDFPPKMNLAGRQ